MVFVVRAAYCLLSTGLVNGPKSAERENRTQRVWSNNNRIRAGPECVFLYDCDCITILRMETITYTSVCMYAYGEIGATGINVTSAARVRNE